MNDVAGTRLLESLKQLNQHSTPDTLVFGKVISVSPLKIKIKEGVIIPESHLFLGQMCRPYKVTIPHTHKYSGKTENAKTSISATTTGTVGPSPTPGVITITDTGHTHDIKDQETDDVHKENCGTDFEKSVTIEIEPKLKNNDTVLMFAFNNYQMFYVAERIEEE